MARKKKAAAAPAPKTADEKAESKTAAAFLKAETGAADEREERRVAYRKALMKGGKTAAEADSIVNYIFHV